MKTILTKVHLINWYGFIDEIIPVAPELTLISGENECGKSTILDAIKYAYTGDTLFNKSSAGATQGLGKRTIISYTRCLLDASASKYARSPETMPLVYTHIALEYKNEPEGRSFVLGVIIETGTTDVRTNDWYALDQMTIDELELTYEEEGQTKPYGKELFQKRYRTPLMGKKEGIERFMQMVGLKLPYTEVSRYQRKLHNIMTYNPEAKIREFIKESVLEEYDINFTKLRDAKNNIDDITRKLDLIEREIGDLDGILGNFAEYDRLEGRLTVETIKSIYKKVCDGEERLNEIVINIEKEAMEIESLGRQINTLDEKYREADDLYVQANRELQDSDVARAITTAEQTVGKLQERLEFLQAACEQIREFGRELDAAGELIREMGETPVESVSLASSEVSASEKESFVKRTGERLSSMRDKKVSERALINQKIFEIDESLKHEREVIIACDKNKPDYTYAGEQTALVAEINREFDKEGIADRARMACEYVVGFTDESWRDAIEAFLGVHRFAVLVPPEYFSVANRVLDGSRHRYVELINTPLLMRKSYEAKEHSVYEKLIIKNETAAAYFCFWLGRIRATTRDEVAKYGSAMSKEGKLARNMAITYINTRSLKTYALGSEAILLNKKRAEKRINELNSEKETVLAEEAACLSQIEKLGAILGLFKEYPWEAPAELVRVEDELNREKERLYELKEAQKNNAEFIALSERVARLREDVNRISEERSDKVTRQATLKGQIEVDKSSEKSIRYALDENREKLEEWKGRRASAAETAIQNYDGFLAGTNTYGDVMKPVTRERNERELRRLAEELSKKQIGYNNRNQGNTEGLPVGVEHEAVYQRRREKIWVDDLQVMREKFREQTDRYEDIFKKEFVLTIFDKSQTAIRDLRDINRELRRLTFTTQYRFEVRMLEDGSDYAKIIAYARYLQDTNNLADEGQRLMTEAVGIDAALAEQHEKEIREIINRLIEQDDDKEIKKYADYRNYMSYEIIINNDDVKDGKLSKQMGYNSGAGTQIPYTLILSASLSMLYNVRSNSTRLIFIDEPFEKMSDANIERMLEFFKSQDFQVVFCAPPNKLEAIGSACGVIIPVIKYANEDMRIGEVRFYR